MGKMGKRRFKDSRNAQQNRNSDHRSKGCAKNPDTNATRDTHLSSLNDISWYSKYPELVETASRFPYSIKPGSGFNVGKYFVPVASMPDKLTLSDANISMPGIMKLDWLPSVGVSQTTTDPASVVARELYSRVRSKFSSSLDVDPPDFLMYVMSLDSIFSYIGSLKRIYRILMAYTPQNYLLPGVLLDALGVGENYAADLLRNKADFLQSINELIYMSRRFTCPAVMDIFNRHYWMNDNVYTDAPVVSSQMYVFRQSHFFKFKLQPTPDGVDASGLFQVAAPTFNANTKPHEVMFNYGKALIEELSAWDDAYTINGYLMRAFEGEQNFIVDLLQADEEFTPVYVEEVLMQIENSRALGTVGTIQPIVVSQDPKSNKVISTPKYNITNVLYECYGGIENWLSMRNPAPTWQENVIATRLSAYVDEQSDGTDHLIYAGTEIPWRWMLYTFHDDWDLFPGSIQRYGMNQVQLIDLAQGSTESGVRSDLISMLRVSQFDWHPQFFAAVKGQGGVNAITLVGDTHHISVLKRLDLKNLHKICIYSEFNAFSI